MAVAEAWAEGGSADALRAFGMTDDDLMTELDVLPANLPTIDVFFAMNTQWRSSGMGGPTGLDYSALPAVMSLLGIVKPRQQRDVFDGLRAMEGEALRVFGEQQK